MRTALLRVPSVIGGAPHTTLWLVRIEAYAKRVRSLVFSSYHPERHYMRGPGPKWREKHGALEPFNPGQP
jgi:hypothetical protein